MVIVHEKNSNSICWITLSRMATDANVQHGYLAIDEDWSVLRFKSVNKNKKMTRKVR
ncbi:hypothetical protein [Bacillus paranthracis]|uniref:Uncharacterized protein n=1 Tax=Metabacillus malikii TaxID=1504265 RepID=A0ABT9ZI96_9BACI|nr:hypothetical protein [Bacillus paranthracis]MCR6466037.1 hypothetical protein [Bacillus paranthracis]MDQ0232000.1 hypothetical protein [Metabacillus malikii]